MTLLSPATPFTPSCCFSTNARLPGGRVAAEDGDGVALRAGHVHVRAVGADGDPLRPLHAIDAVEALELLLDQREGAAARIPSEHRHREAVPPDRVERRAIGADRQAERHTQALDPADALFLMLHVGELAPRGVAGE